MALSAGTRLGPYEILAPLGAGGMGEVYRARDAKLGREVAIKVLPEEFTQHPEKLARFEREARLLAALNHPGIATLHGLEESGGEPFLVMELVSGETLGERIDRGALPVEEALPLAQQIAQALEAAHEGGVIHRDLKPANIKIDTEGQAKVLDFGLAKAWADDGDGASSSASMSQSPTLAHSGTQAGVILGTAAYMSPEQAKGKAVDKRTDVFSFGVVLFEMLTGKKAFAGEDVSEILAGVIKMEPQWQALPSSLDGRIQGLLRRCLRKDRKKRLQAIGDVRVEIDDVLADPTPAPLQPPHSVSPSGRPLVRIAVWAGALLLAALVGGLVRRPEPPAPTVTRFAVTLSPEQRFTGRFRRVVALSPDGTRLVFVVNRQLYLREMDQPEAVPIRGTDIQPTSPFFSPDGQWVGFYAKKALKKVPVAGGTPVTLCETATGMGANWGADDSIVFVDEGAILRVSANGGTPEVLIPMTDADEMVFGPQMLPDGKTVLLTRRSVVKTFEFQIVTQSLETGERRVLIEDGSDARYLPTGHLVFAKEETLLAVPFDLERLETTGDSVPVVEPVYKTASVVAPSHFALSDSGTLAYLPGDVGAHRTLGWMNRAGEVKPLTQESGPFGRLRVSPDGQRVALENGEDIWIYDIERDTMARLTREGRNWTPVWSPDGQWVAFSSDRGEGPDLYRQRADLSGPAEVLLEKPYPQQPGSWSPDGSLLVYTDASHTGGGLDLWALPPQGDGEPRALVETPYWNNTVDVSPDGHWVAYESGAPRGIYVQPFPDGGGNSLIGTGADPVWSPSGRELFYVNDLDMMVVDVETKSEFRASPPRRLFEAPHRLHGRYDVAPDGQRFLVNLPEEGSRLGRINVVLNWSEELKRLVPTE